MPQLTKSMKSLFIATLATLASLQVLSQQPIRTCPSDEKNNQLLQTDPVFHRSFQNMERILRQRESAPYLNDRIDGVLTIPVVVHVIHLGEAVGTGSNISDAQVQSAITALNEDFRRLAGTNGFGDGVDVELEFCLASRTPQNQSTNGIVRVNGSSVPNYATQGITANGTIGASELAVKQLSNWPRESYMNIWVVSEIENNNGGAGIQGYAYFPFNSVLDGVVVQYRAFGTVGTLNSFTNANRTLTHEVGHYLNLYHTFENTSNCSPSGSCSTQGDRVCDTPPTVQNSSCSSPTCSGALVANYMDYTPETCQNMFTAGQKLRMRTALETQRGSLLNSLGCVPVNDLDVGVSAILDPADTVCEGGLSPVVVVYNYGSQTVTSLNLNYSINGGPTSVFAWTGSLLSGTTTNITLPSINLPAGSQSITVFTNGPNGGADENATNNSSASNFYVASGANAIVTVVLDDWGSETTWNVKTTQTPPVIVASGGPYQNQSQGVVISDRFCLATDCGVVCPAGGGTGCNYTFSVFDSFGDGQGYQTGSISLTTSSGVTTFTNDWGTTQSTNFCVAGSGGSSGSSVPDANFNIQDNTVCPGTQVDFTNTSTNNPTSFSWTFEGGSPSTSSLSNPQNIVWNTPGTYDVTLTVTNSAGSDTYVCSNCMTVYASPTVSLTGTNPACNGQSNGSISSTVTGTGPFTYLWSNSATTNNISNLAAGSYSVTVTSSTGCIATGSATLANPAILSVTTSAVNPSCSNTSNGSISTTVTGGTGNKTYLWTPGNAVTSSLSNLLPGTYSVTVTDSRGCTATASSTLSAPAAISLNYTVSNMLCSTGNTGSINGSASGGSGTYTYLWTPGNANTASLTNLSGGTYSLSVTDGAGCSKTQSYTVSTPSPIVITGTVTPPNCPGGNGSISVSASGGTGNKTFAWNTGANTASVVVGAGSYSVTATDANGCTSTQTFNVTAPSSLTVTANLVQPTCNGLSNGSISLSLPGSVGAVTYDWGSGITGAVRNGLSAGAYSVTATYGIGCNVTGNFQLIQPSALTATIVSSTSPTCNGGSDGEILVGASGGTAPYNYNWGGGVNGTFISDLDAGSYTANVSDANGCSTIVTATLTNPLAIQLEGIVSDAQCGDANGTIDVMVLNAIGSVTYNWAGNVAQGSNPNGLAAGSYTLNVTDSLGCTASEIFLVQTPGNLSLSEVIVNASCANVSNGSIDLEVSGGTPPYSFLWLNGYNTASISSIGAGNYAVNVTDSAGCVISEIFEVTNQYAVNLSLSSSNPLCINSTDGSATATLTGAIGSVDYEWSNGFNGSSNSALSSGVLYSVVATDANGCSASDEITLSAPSAISIVSSFTPPSCGGTNNGAVFFSVTGGTGGYTYTWDDGNTIVALGDTDTPPSPVTDLAPGNYTLSIEDANGCSAQRVFPLIAPSLISVADTIQGISCNGGSDGSIELTLSGGNGALNVLWSNGQVGLTNDSLSAGQYTATITDENNCGVERTFTLLNPEGLMVSLAGSDPLCYGGDDGFVASAVSGGTGNYSYLWSNASTQNNIADLTAGFYSLTVGDENGCSAEAIVELTQPNDIQIDIAIVNAQCDGSILGSAFATIIGGTAPLTYAWSDDASAALNRDNLNAGNYTLQVTDANGCTVSQNEAVYALSAATVEIVAFEDPRCYESADGSVEVYINGGDGTEVISWLRNNLLLEGLDSLAYSNLAAGNYRVVATDSQGCSAFAEVTLENPEAVVGNISVSQDISCNGYADGALSVIAVGGTGALTYQWENGDTTPSIDSLSAGSYSLTITDSQGCSSVDSLDLSQPELLSYTATFSNPSCVGNNDGSIEIFVTGGTAPYSYDWNGLGSASSLSDLTPDTYGFSVIDINGCLLTSEIVITEPSAIELIIEVSNVTCFGYEDGSLSALVTGGTAPYEYSWSGPANSYETNPVNIPAGDYDLTVTDANGCSISTTATVTQPDQLNADAMIFDASCLDPLGSAEVTAFGGTEPYEYNWSTAAGVFISSQSTVQDLGSGDYRFLLTDVNNCSVIVDFSISEVLELNVALTAMNVSCFGNIDGSITTAVSNGLPPYQYTWNTGDSTQNLSGLAAGGYTVDVVDDNGCIGSASATLSMPELLTATVDSMADVSCYGGNNGLISVSASGGVSPYLYLWNGEVFGSLRNDLAADTFNITISDDMGCLVVIQDQIIAEPSQIAVTVMFEDQSCVANNGSINLDVVGGVSPFNVSWSNGEIGFEVLDLTAGNYSADITDNNGCEVSIEQNIGTYCYETQLTSQYCTSPPSSVSLLENIQCDFVQGGTSYVWSFYYNGSLLGTTTTSSTLLSVSDITGVFPGALLGVQVAVEVDGLLYPSLSDCFIQIAELPTTQLVAEDCNASISDSSFILNCIAMQDAVQYTWAIQGVSLLDTIETTNPALLISEILNLESNQSYSVTIGYSTADGFDSPFGSPCNFTMQFDTDTSTTDTTTFVNEILNYDQFTIYPNPGDGRTLSVKNAPRGSLRITDGTGRFIYTVEPVGKPIDTDQRYTLPAALPSGVYFVGFDQGRMLPWVVR